MPSRGAGEPTIVLYDEEESPTCAKIRKLMDYKGLRYRRIRVPYHDKRRLLKETGQDYVPFLRDGRRGIPWPDAVDYLETIRPRPSAYPSGLREICKVLESWEYDWFEDRIWEIVAPFVVLRYTDEVERWNFTETWERVYGPFEAIRRDPRSVWERLHPPLQKLEDCLRARDFLLADAPSAFDFAIYGNVHALAVARVPIPARYPRLRSWSHRMERL